MSGTESKYERIIKYLKGLLSNRERHDLEKEMTQDAFEEEAFEGLTLMSGDELKADMEILRNRLKNRVESSRKRNLGIFYRIAAAIILLAGISGVLYLIFRMPAQNLITEEAGNKIHKAPSQIIPPSATDTAFITERRPVTKSERVKSPPAVPEKPESRVNRSVETGIAGTMTKTMAAEAVAEESVAREAAVSDKEVAEKEKNVEEQVFAQKKMADNEEKAEGKTAVGEKNAGNEPVSEEYRELAVSRRRSEAAAPSAAGKAGRVQSMATVMDTDGNPLPGVTILEKGSTHGTVTDIDGKFSLEPFDKGSVLELSYIGYAPLEINTNDVAGKEIKMTEDLIALDEVVVVGYGVQKKSDETGAVARLQMEDITPQGNTAAPGIINPVPPGGSVKAFKQWVHQRLNKSVMNAYNERQKILVTLTVQTDGSVSDIHIKEDVPEALAKEFTRIISQSPRWQPAMKDDLPVVTKVAVRFAVGKE
jgi:hypothetical protein